MNEQAMKRLDYIISTFLADIVKNKGNGPGESWSRGFAMGRLYGVVGEYLSRRDIDYETYYAITSMADAL